jgi:hypothetical protein
MLIRAKDLADAAKQKALDGREEWRQKAQDLIQEARADVDKARDTAEKARGAATRRDLKATAKKAATALFDAEKAFDAGRYIEAHAKAEDAKALADVDDEEDETPVAKTSRSTNLS